MLATYINENKIKAVKKLFSYTKEKINNNLEIITIILNILLLYFNPYLWLIILTNISIIGLYKNHTFELTFKIIKKDKENKQEKIDQICAGEFTEIDGRLYDENGKIVTGNILKTKHD